MDCPLRSAGHRSFWALAASLLFCAALLLSACALPLPGGTSTEPHHGGSIVDAILGDTASLIPAQAELTMDVAVDQAIWAPLWYGDPTGALHPGLAQRVPSQANGDVSADLKTWTIHLRPNLKWSDGSPLSAADVAFSLNTFADPHFANNIGFPTTDPGDPIGFLGASVRNSTTVQFSLAHPYVAMTALLADGVAGPIPQEVFGAMTPGDIPKSHENFFPTVTSGPFKVVDHAQGDHVTLIRDPYYYQGPDKPYLDQITLRIFPTADAVLAAAQARTLDVAYEGVSNLSARLLDSYRALPGYATSLDRYPSGYEVIVFNLANPILGDKVVRRALSMGLDPKQITALGKPGTIVPTCDNHAGTFAHEPSLTCYPQDPTNARQLLDHDGWILDANGLRHKDGKTLELTYSTTNIARIELRARIEDVVRSAWAQIGVKIDIKNYDSGQDFFARVLPAGNFDIAEYNNNFNGYDPDDHSLFMCDQTPDKGGSNVMHYCNPAVDRAESAQQATTDQAARLAAFKTIDRAVLDDLPLMYFYSLANIGIHRSTLHNYAPFPSGTDLWNAWDWYLDQG